jgi:hypothetical protein
MRNRVRVMCKPGSAGDLGGQPPRSTRTPWRPIGQFLIVGPGVADKYVRTIGVNVAHGQVDSLSGPGPDTLGVEKPLARNADVGDSILAIFFQQYTEK